MRKVAIVTGGNGEIGSFIAIRLSDKYNVVVTYNKSEDNAERVLEKLKGNPMKVNVDLRSVDSIQSMFSKVYQKYKRIDLLVNNASFTKESSMEDMEESIINRVIDLNIKSTFYCSREFLKYTNKIEDFSIINIGSNSVRTLNASNVVYIACKAAMESLTKSFAKNYGELVRVNCVNPGLIKSNLSSEFFDKRKLYVLDGTPMRKLCNSEDVAEVVHNIAVNFQLVTGQCIDVDGGRSL
jgi:3-oxoacyl-[acyl-carrier protein] reductase